MRPTSIGRCGVRWRPSHSGSGIRDDDVLERMTQEPEEIIEALPAMKRLGHVPFNGAEAPVSWLPRRTPTEAAIEGHVDGLAPVSTRRSSAW